ncbi:MAG: FAD-binding protein, partial [Phycisphaerae bacterium]|nr:FAD-binding protein [candidate division KSB1 bacterium]NIT72490.1 FAD-binding protein [candidate division KSB1 bacterium]NIV01368.1 FAD-binding protein [Phycisphaerae bacterium]NIW70630.1 FAD-binding protein [candidate division KSB1 bacterium]NIX72170.1 FAD-binding protein [candidate division KSB1 bacterium]
MRVGGPARYFISPRTPKDVREAITFARENNLPFFVLGGGSNVVFPDEG